MSDDSEPKYTHDTALSFQHAKVTPTSQAAAPSAPVVPGVEIKMQWTPFKNRPGHWIPSRSNPLLRDTLLAAPNKTMDHSGFRYKLSGDNDAFIDRFVLEAPRK